MFWGFTPAVDLLEQCDSHLLKFPEKELNVLIIGGSDCRHVLRTLSKRFRHEPVKLNFYLVEGAVETIAKQLLLLNVALQEPAELGLVIKTKIFMELYGNTLVRPSVAKYLRATASELIDMVTNYDYLRETMPNIALKMKYKERDYMENLLKFWCGIDEFDICRYWDVRLRKILGVRYDSKIGAFDWDLNMRFRCVGGQQVASQEYRNFRLNGIAFTWLESEVSKPNRSMVCVVQDNGDTFLHYGYLGDMQTGPFVAFGLECDDHNYLKQVNGQQFFRATDVTERNLNQIFYELIHQKPYVHQAFASIPMGQVVLQTPERMVVDIKSSAGGDVKMKRSKCANLDDVYVEFSTTSLLQLMEFREKYRNLFHCIYLSGAHLKFLTNKLIDNSAKDNCLLLIENQKFVLSYRDKDLKDYQWRVEDTVKEMPLIKALENDALNDNYFKYIIKKT